ncbi:MAG: hypothetical protein DHS20C10_04550 [marine bacterium B5-7]|nr:MAG: hypothetical protein DHS20C10_04550 [marine bacterium B5-7]
MVVKTNGSRYAERMMNAMSNFTRRLAFLAGVFLLSACGQSGPLTLPVSDQPVKAMTGSP